jgi:superfamily II DNA or RNA helicase
MAQIDMTIRHSDKSVVLEVGYVCSVLDGDVPAVVLDKLNDALSYYVPGYQWSQAFKKGYFDRKTNKWSYWDGKTYLLKNARTFPTGLLDRVKEVIEASGMKVTIKDTRKTVKCGKPIQIENIESRDYQDRAVEAALKHKSGIIKICTGGGKSVVLARIAAELNVKAMIYVISIDLLYQMKELFERVLDTEVGMIGDGISEVRPITIATVWSAAKALDSKITFNEDEFGRKESFNAGNKNNIVKAIQGAELIFFDECQLLGAQSLQDINKASKSARYKFGMSGTPHRDDGLDILLEAAVGRKIIDVPASELIGQGFLVKPVIHFINVDEGSEELGVNYQSIYKKFIVENQDRNAKIVEAANKLKDAGRKTLILVKNLAHGEALIEMFDPKVVIHFVRGDLDSEERNRIRNDFVKGKIDVIVASSVYDAGIDIPTLDALILAGSGKSSVKALQRIGRVIRPAPNKKSAIVVDFLDNAKYLYNHSLRRLQVYRTEDGFDIKLPKEFREDNGEYKTKIKKQVPKPGGGSDLPW